MILLIKKRRKKRRNPINIDKFTITYKAFNASFKESVKNDPLYNK